MSGLAAVGTDAGGGNPALPVRADYFLSHVWVKTGTPSGVVLFSPGVVSFGGHPVIDTYGGLGSLPSITPTSSWTLWQLQYIENGGAQLFGARVVQAGFSDIYYASPMGTVDFAEALAANTVPSARLRFTAPANDRDAVFLQATRHSALRRLVSRLVRYR